MIVSDTITWLHLPKTGGTSTAQVFRDLNIPGIRVDPDHEDAKHESVENRLNSLRIAKKTQTIITTRRLANWLLSDWHHKTIKMGLQLPFSPVKSGLFYSLRLGGTWVAADYWIHYFDATSCDRVVRLENIEEDANNMVLPLLPKGTKKLKFPRKNTNNYMKQLETFFNHKDLKRIYANNPCWSHWESAVYGNRQQINSLRRLSTKSKSLLTRSLLKKSPT